MVRELSKIGDKFNRLIIEDIKLEYVKICNMRFAYCLCDCGNRTKVILGDLKSNRIKSCGCLQKDIATNTCINRSKHGLSRDKLYWIWKGMKSRCLNKNSTHYDSYGGRGITICNEWLNDFIKFKNWSLENGYKEKLTIDRINNNGNYSPENCRWTNMYEQCRNRKSNVIITAFGETKILADWLKDSRCKINFSSLKYRLDRGWPPEKAISYDRTKGKDRHLGQPQ